MTILGSAMGLALMLAGGAGAQDNAAAAVHYTLDTPIKVLVADPAAKAVLDKDLPGMSSDENLPKFEDKSLRQLQPLTGGQLTDTLMTEVGADLAALDGSAVPAADAAAPATDAAPAPEASAPVGR